MTERTHVHEPWLSRRHWRRLLEAYATGRISRAEFVALKRRLARTRAGDPAQASPARPPPALRLLPGGRPRALPPSPFTPTPREAA